MKKQKFKRMFCAILTILLCVTASYKMANVNPTVSHFCTHNEDPDVPISTKNYLAFF